MHKLSSLVLCLILVALNAPYTSSAQTMPVCDGLLPSRLVPGDMGRVMAGVGNRIRAFPGTNTSVVTVIPAEAEFQVVLGPACVNGYAWWFVNWNGYVGWTAEGDAEAYWLEPAAVSAAPETAPEADYVWEYDYVGVKQIVLSAVATSMTPRFVAAASVVYGTEPAHTSITFESHASNSNRVPQIRIYATEDYVQATGFDLTELQNAQTASPEDIPLVPELRINARQEFIVHRQPLAFRNGYGVRYIAAYSQAPIVYADGDPVYIFTGMTHDGQHVIVAQFPLDSALLPSANAASTMIESLLASDFFFLNYEDYRNGTGLMLDAAAPEWFTPTLNTLDRFMESLEVEANIRIPVAHAGVTFDVYSALLPEPTAQTLDEVSDEGTPGYLRHPAGVEFVFLPPSAFNPGASLYVYRASDYERVYGVSLDALRQTLADRSQAPDTSVGPIINANRVIAAQPAYVDFAGGAGVRYVAQWSQDIKTISPQMIYVFAGLTDDSEYFILAQITTGALAVTQAPELLPYSTMSIDELGAVYSEMIAQANVVANGLHPFQFYRPLDWLDRVIMSLVVQPTFGT